MFNTWLLVKLDLRFLSSLPLDNFFSFPAPFLISILPSGSSLYLQLFESLLLRDVFVRCVRMQGVVIIKGKLKLSVLRWIKLEGIRRW